jgi:hypothetical protein
MFINDLQHDPALQGTVLLFANCMHFGCIVGFEACMQMFQERVTVEISNILWRKSHVDTILALYSVCQAYQIPIVNVGIRGNIGIEDACEHLSMHLLHQLVNIVRLQHISPLAVDHFALFVHHIVILEEVLANLKVVSFDLALGILNSFCNHGVLDRLAFFHAQFGHDARDTV